jgi:ABC-type lipoprotein export system ATPase subunit
MTVLSVSAVSHAYGDGADRVLVLDDVSLHVDAGEVVCVAGPSGSGKTSLCHLAAGFEVPMSGTVTVDGTPSTTLDDWAVVAALPQQHGLLGELSVRANVALPGQRAGRGSRRLTKLPELPELPELQRLLEALDLAGLADRAVDETSLGEQQRAALARALVLSPRLAVLDEPTGHQDDDHVAQVLAAVRQSTASGTGVLIASHDDRVLEAADRVLRLDRGRLLA